MPTYIKTCIDCGKEFTANGHNAKRCKECGRVRQRKQQARYFAERNKSWQIPKAKPHKPKKPKLTLNEVLRQLDRYNKEHNTCLTYGQFIQIKDGGI